MKYNVYIFYNGNDNVFLSKKLMNFISIYGIVIVYDLFYFKLLCLFLNWCDAWYIGSGYGNG